MVLSCIKRDSKHGSWTRCWVWLVMNQDWYYESRIHTNARNCRQLISPKDWPRPAGRPWSPTPAVPSGGETRNCVGSGYNLWPWQVAWSAVVLWSAGQYSVRLDSGRRSEGSVDIQHVYVFVVICVRFADCVFLLAVNLAGAIFLPR